MLKLVHSLFAVLLFSALQSNAITAETVTVVMSTNAGDITLELYPEAAPITVANFLKYVDAHRYDNKASFYRTVRMDNQAQNNIKIEVIQGGLGMEESDLMFEAIAHETTKTSHILHKDCVLSMARLPPNSTTSEFLICRNNQPGLDFGGERNPDGLGFASFGKVVNGMDVVLQIQNMRTDAPEGQELDYTSGQMLVEPVMIYQIYRIQDK